MNDITVVVVTYNSEDVIEDCLTSCAGLNVVVVDNGSADGTLARIAKHPGVRLIANHVNRGFGGAVNQAVMTIESDYILLLNPDVRLRDSPAGLARVLDHDARTGIAAGMLTDSDGAPQKGFTIRRFPTAAALIFEVLGINRLLPANPVNRHYRYLDRNFTSATEVDQPAGAFLVLRRELWRALEGFDERFFPVWFEDVDFCRRAVSAGWRILFVPAVRAYHAGGHSVKQLTSECRELFWYGSLLKYAARHFPPWKARVISTAVVLGSVLRAVAGAAVSRSLKPLAIHLKVVRVAVASIISGGSRSGTVSEWRMQTDVARKQE